jgi:hypothetical protein
MISLLIKYPGRLCTLPCIHQFLVTQTSKAHAPALENHYFDGGFVVFVDDFPSFWFCAIAFAIVERFVVAGDANVWFAGCELGEYLFAEGDVVGGGLAAVLD